MDDFDIGEILGLFDFYDWDSELIKVNYEV